MGWGFHRAEGVDAPIWQQAASTLAAYAMFLGVLVIGAIVRSFWFRRLRIDQLAIPTGTPKVS